MTRALATLVSALGLIACGGEPAVRLNYQLGPGVALSEIVRVETSVRVAPTDPRRFFADQGFRLVAPGVGYEVRDFDGDGERVLLITHDAALGFEFVSSFAFTLLAPVGEAPPLVVEARAVGASEAMARSVRQEAKFDAGTSIDLLLADVRCGGVTCAGDQACCAGACVDTQGDAASCGGCGLGCAPLGDGCSGGICRCQGGSACAEGTACCPGLGCADVLSDPFNCGGCNNPCAPGETCEAGQCRCGATSCADGELCCPGDPTPSCATSCTCGTATCDATTPLCCGDFCAQPVDDDLNCGACGTTCLPGTSCKLGNCLCQGLVKCEGADACCANGCANLSNTPEHCGACDVACGQGSKCDNGSCHCGSDTCDASEICCGEICVPKTSVNHCGGCGIACNPGEACQGGKCQCPDSGEQHCTGAQRCCPGQGCYDVSADPLHCGAACVDCGGSACIDGQCEASPCTVECGFNARCCEEGCVPIDDQHCADCRNDCTKSGQTCCTSAPVPYCIGGGGTTFAPLCLIGPSTD